MNCFAHGHIAKDCSLDFICMIEGCGERRKYLHLSNKKGPGIDDVMPEVMPQVSVEVTPIVNTEPHYDP